MIIKGKSNKKKIPIGIIVLLLLAALAIAVLYTDGLDYMIGTKQSDQSLIYCDAETRSGDHFISNGNTFDGGQTQSTKFAYSDSASSRTDGNQRFGMSYTIYNVLPGEVYRAEVRRYTAQGETGFLYAISNDSTAVNVRTSEHTSYDEEWWFRIMLTFAIPEDGQVQSVKVGVYNSGNVETYFDDLKIEKIQSAKTDSTIKHSFFNQELQLLINSDAQGKLKAIRDKARGETVFRKDADSEVNAAILVGPVKQKIKLRYKGDWLDHILGPQPSYRIETKSDQLWNGLQSFSIQHPKTRGYMREWVYHDLLGKDDILSPRYDFIRVRVNDQAEQVYAIEEHFTKFLVESQKRREGPIIKLSEDIFWEGMARYWKVAGITAPVENKNEGLWDSAIDPFKMKRTAKDTNLSRQFEIAQNLVTRYKREEGPIDEIFDIDKLARFMAISELCMAEHSLTWHNQRFYYNPVISLLEPIGFDCTVLDQYFESLMEKLYVEKVYLHPLNAKEPVNRIFYDQGFLKLFFKYLSIYSQFDFIETYLAKQESEINKRVELIQLNTPTYTYNKNELRDRAKKIRMTLEPFAGALMAYSSSTSTDSVEVELQNLHALPIEVTWKNNDAKDAILVTPQHPQKIPTYVRIRVPSYITTLEYRLPGSVNWQKSSIRPWQSPSTHIPRGRLLTLSSIQDTSLFLIDGKRVIMKNGRHLIDKIIVIPPNYVLDIRPGTMIEFTGDGKIISQSPVSAIGSEDYPILIRGDQQGGSFTVLQANEMSEMAYVYFDNQNTMSYQGWNLTGAVTFYESDVRIAYCKFNHNVCEDALNIIRSDFQINHCEFSNTFSDAFDADFCTGKLSNSFFLNTGNDAIDFSTSIVTIQDCRMKTIGDKAISAGEQATIKATGIEVDGAITGFASKDRSVLELRNVTLKNCQTGFTAYQKKPEYGPATIKVYGHTAENVKNLFLIESSSKLIQ
jgi:hypothetical protein